MQYNFTVSHQLQHICIQQVSTLLQFKVWQPNKGKLSIAIFWVTWRNQKPLFHLSQETSARLLPGPSSRCQPFSDQNRTFMLLIRSTPEHKAACHEKHPKADEPSLRPTQSPSCEVGRLSRKGIEALDFTLHSCRRRQRGWAPAINAFSLELCKASSAQLSHPWEVNPRRAELFTNLFTLRFQEDVSTSEFFAQAAEIPSNYFEQLKSNLQVCVLTLWPRAMICKQTLLLQS